MSCGAYCYQRQWDCRAGRLKKLSQVQIKPSPTRNYGSGGARANSIRRRVARYTTNNNNVNSNLKENPKQTLGYGPVFGTAKAPSVFNNCGGCGDKTTTTKNVYRSNGGTGGDVVYWKRIMGGPRQLTTGNDATDDGTCGLNNQCTATKSRNCVLGGNRWLNYRRGCNAACNYNNGTFQR